MIVTLCGSTRFKKEFEEANMKLTLMGHIVLMPGVFLHAMGITIDADTKTRLDALHKEKIKMSNMVIIICPNNYIGESTQSEIEYTNSLNIPIEYWMEQQF
jgi:hypothetical protein